MNNHGLNIYISSGTFGCCYYYAIFLLAMWTRNIRVNPYSSMISVQGSVTYTTSPSTQDVVHGGLVLVWIYYQPALWFEIFLILWKRDRLVPWHSIKCFCNWQIISHLRLFSPEIWRDWNMHQMHSSGRTLQVQWKYGIR